jgi:5-deoxy-glucuronate isomerase
VITQFEEADPTGIRLSVWKLARGEHVTETLAHETAYLLMSGELEVIAGAAEPVVLTRGSLFDDLPSTVHAGRGEKLSFRARGEVELTVYETLNERRLIPRIYLPQDVRDELRGKGQVRNSALRYVRTIFDKENSDPDAELVLGEVVNLPGRWSSYPPHHHPQPEIYHYRFTAPEGWGHAELGDTVLKVRANDTVKIFDGNDHPQCAAPGYGMYYSWVIRHLPEKKYDVPEFSAPHRWILRENATFWWPRDLEKDD